jgi:8-oxo-dGTP pyrophosphatase MutT (NUDIX family)
MSQWMRQAAAIPVFDGKICMVTSSNGRRWVMPKGMIEPGQTAGETALQEAWEEAGVAGVLHSEPIGSYVYEKSGVLHHVTVFLMQVTEEADEWPEAYIRSREWVHIEEAISRVKEQGLRDLISVVMPAACAVA